MATKIIFVDDVCTSDKKQQKINKRQIKKLIMKLRTIKGEEYGRKHNN